jgi:hypothetical protein
LAISLNLSFFLILVIFARWKQIEKSLTNSLYEEASWYDGQVWENLFDFKK